MRVVKIGVLGGTFDPVHLGHLMIADAAMVSLALSEILFVPAGRPLLKIAPAITPAEHRLQMLRLAIRDNLYFRVSAMEIERAGPSYTVDTIAELRGQYGGKDEIFFILGWGTLAQMPEWREPSRIIEMCYLVAVPRPGDPRPDLEALEASIPSISQRVVLLDEPNIDISGSAIRERAAHGLSLRHLVPRAVEEYIKRHKLYLAH
ncbi:MAG: nicotinate (nicotinamide) nucleotide adenylyltransferase [Chloroflexi bacterium RBG_16_50_9]|nr:MAG: nicotinate (nicotinamide) nucleotide adenylyltransferase [Chloroflexi bacterium RBG_16_50_9]